MSTSTALDKITLKNQTTSPFLRLPPEIRNQIYAYIFGGHTVRPEENRSRYLDASFHKHVRPRFEAYHWRYNIKLLQFLKTCRQIHAEARLLPFSLSVFEGEVDYTTHQVFQDLRLEHAGTIMHVRLEISMADLVLDGSKTGVTHLKPNLRYLVDILDRRCSGLAKVSLEFRSDVGRDVKDAARDLVEKQFVRGGRGDFRVEVDEEVKFERRRDWAGKYTL